MRKSLIFIIILSIFEFMLSSCGRHIEKLHKTETAHVEKTNIIDSSRYNYVDTGSTLTKELLDTTILIPEINIEDSSNLDSNSNYYIDDSTYLKMLSVDNYTITTKFNKNTKKLSTIVNKKPEEKHLLIDKETSTKNGISVSNNTNKSLSKVDSTNKTIIDSKSKITHGRPNWTIIIIVIVFIVIILIWFIGFPKKK